MKKISAVMIMTLAFSCTEIYAANQSDWARTVEAATLMQSVQALKSEAAQGQVTLVTSQLPPVPGLKLTLNEQEKKKFLELAKYAQKLTDVKIIERGWLLPARHFFQLRGRFADDGSYHLTGFNLDGRDFMDSFRFQISSDGLVDKTIISFMGVRYNLESQEVQAMLTKEIAFWMSCQVPK